MSNNIRRPLIRGFIVLIPFILFGCSAIVKTMYGIKDPKIETKESLFKFLSKKKLDTTNVYCVSFEDFKPTLSLTNNKIPDVLIFNKQGEYIPYGDEWACNASAFNFIEELNLDTIYTKTDLVVLDTLLSRFKTFDGKQISENEISKIKNADFVCIVLWAKFTGKLNKTKVKEWEEQAKRNKNVKINFIKLDMDFQEWWGLDESDINVNK